MLPLLGFPRSPRMRLAEPSPACFPRRLRLSPVEQTYPRYLPPLASPSRTSGSQFEQSRCQTFAHGKIKRTRHTLSGYLCSPMQGPPKSISIEKFEARVYTTPRAAATGCTVSYSTMEICTLGTTNWSKRLSWLTVRHESRPNRRRSEISSIRA